MPFLLPAVWDGMKSSCYFREKMVKYFLYIVKYICTEGCAEAVLLFRLILKQDESEGNMRHER